MAIFGGAATLAAGLVAWRLAARSSPDAGAIASASPLGRRGESYRLSFTQELRSTQGPPRRVRIDGLWQSVGPRTAGADPAERAFRLVDARFTPEAGGTPADARAFSDAVAHPFLVSYDHQRPVRAAFDPGTTPAVRNLLLTLVVELGCEPPRTDTTRVTPERDLFGRYLAALRPDPDRRGVERHKLRYLDLTVPEARTPIQTAIAISIAESTWRCRVAADGTLERLDGTEQVTVDTGVPGLAPEVRTELHLEASGDFDAGPVAAALAEARATLAATPIVTQRVDPAAAGRSADEDLVRGAPLAEVLTPFARMSTAPASGTLAERHAAIARLAAFVRLDPTSILEIARQIRARSQEAPALVQALGLANRPEPRRTLVDLARDAGVTGGLRVAAIRGLAQDDPDPATLASLESLLDDGDPTLREAAAYAYGASLAAQRRLDPAAAAAALARLAARVGPSGARDRRILALRALGNAGDAAALPAIQLALDDSDPDLREAAVQALSSVMAPGVDELITRVLRHDASPRVRARAIFVAGQRDPTTYADAIADLAVRDPDGSVRSSAVALLGHLLATAPRAREALAQVASADPDPELRKRAHQLLVSPAAEARQAPGDRRAR
ncbi:MAG TPA: HEAT repeat domain-containing protein [Kofleriaceae bacterium]|nr:HEAT repeat domain-containing protein [Kofleriaceae bacterium]